MIPSSDFLVLIQAYVEYLTWNAWSKTGERPFEYRFPSEVSSGDKRTLYVPIFSRRGFHGQMKRLEEWVETGGIPEDYEMSGHGGKRKGTGGPRVDNDGQRGPHVT
jgi:hypothetical protein